MINFEQQQQQIQFSNIVNFFFVFDCREKGGDGRDQFKKKMHLINLKRKLIKIKRPL